MSDTPQLNLYQKLAAITGEVGAIKKGGRNNEQKFDFIEYAAVAGELRNLFAKYNVIVIPRMPGTASQRRQEVVSKSGAKGTAVLIDFVFEVINADKPDERFEVTWTGEALDYGDKATNKAATSALKYYLMRQFNISEKGEDPDASSPERGSVVSTEPVVETEPEPIDMNTAPASKLQKARITAMLRGAGVSDEKFAAIVATAYGMDLAALTMSDANKLMASIKANPPSTEPVVETEPEPESVPEKAAA